jgi:iron-sulfur cluster insertion protein
MSELVVVTQSAAKRVAFLVNQEGNPNAALRVAVNGGGCSGFQYGFSLDESRNDDDLVIEKEGATVLVDMMSQLYLAGSEIDFIEDVIGSSFQVRNPNATSECGCGTSFSV